MCLVVFAYRVHPDYELILLANRDEFHARPTQGLQRWDADFFAGRDRHAGGSWLGLHHDGRFAALTNVREGPPRLSPRSRGELISGFLSEVDWAVPSPSTAARDYSGFNLLLGQWQDDDWRLRFVSNRYAEQALTPGVYALSNGELNSDWPKVRKARQALTSLLDGDTVPSLQWLDALTDRAGADDADLPDTGIGLVKERWLSPCFIVSDGYGTVSSNLVLVASEQLYVGERRYDQHGEIAGATEFRWSRHRQR